MQRIGQARRRSLRAGAVLLLVLALLSVALERSSSMLASVSRSQAALSESRPAQGPVYSIVLPYEEPVVPPGPNQPQFVALCRLCHSTRLVLTQPRFGEKKWTEVVHKMVAVYGAQIPPDQEKAIVDYLMAVRGAD